MNIGAIEAGGTKFICGIVNQQGEVLERISIPTTSPDETMEQVIKYFKTKEFECLGLACFGPVDLNRKSKQYGYITSTPKVKWQNFDILGVLKTEFNCPIGFDTDVNGAALAELKYGAAQGLESCIYITVGTGIGAGAVINGQMVNGLLHPEMGHVYVRRHPQDKYKGKCAFHDDCLEGLAAGPALWERYGQNPLELSENVEVWEMESYYLAQALMNYILIVSPQKIIMGGGVMEQKQLFPLIRKDVQKLLNGYIDKPEIESDDYIIAPKLGNNAGLIGSSLIGLEEYNREIN